MYYILLGLCAPKVASLLSRARFQRQVDDVWSYQASYWMTKLMSNTCENTHTQRQARTHAQTYMYIKVIMLGWREFVGYNDLKKKRKLHVRAVLKFPCTKETIGFCTHMNFILNVNQGRYNLSPHDVCGLKYCVLFCPTYTLL